MAFVVPAVLLGLAIAVMALVSLATQRRNRQAQRAGASPTAAGQSILVHSINDDRCTGCDACVAVCPTNVLDLVENKSRVLRFQDCIQCEACMWACPTSALVMHPERAAANYKMAELDEHYQTKVPGQYLIGEVAGKPLVKNAANLGRAVVEHMLSTGLRGSAPRDVGGVAHVDVAIVGLGPGGLSAALTCIQRGLSYVVFEKENIIASTVARYPKGKLVMAEPYDSVNLSLLPVFDSTKEELVPIWRDLVDKTGMNIRMGETIERAVVRKDGAFDVTSNVGTYLAKRVILATGTRGKPRTLNVPGENLPKVFSLLEDPDLHRGQTVCVVGGGDSSLEAAIALADAGARVILSYRGKSFSRAQPKNRKTIDQYESQRRIKIKFESEVVDIADESLTLQMNDGTQKRYPNEAVFVLIGADPPVEWLGKMGIRFVERPHLFALPKSDALVRRFVPDAITCPDSTAGALALVQRRPVDEVVRDRPQERERPSRAQKFIRSATGIFAKDSKLDKPMPLGEFAKQRRHDGRGRRDQLDARERTRVLRMLRDDGGRLADEDSKLYVIERASSEMSDIAILEATPTPSPAGRAVTASSAPPPYLGQPDLLTTLPPVTTSPPKQAVIVGLARATAQGPRGGAPRKRPTLWEEPTRQLHDFEARALLENHQDDDSIDSPAELADELTAFADMLGELPDDSTDEVELDLLMEQGDITANRAIEAAPPRRRAQLPPPRGRRDDPSSKRERVLSVSDVEWDLDH